MLLIDNLKKCTKCDTWKSVDKFYKNNRKICKGDIYHSECKECHCKGTIKSLKKQIEILGFNKYLKKHREKNPKHCAFINLRKRAKDDGIKFDLTEEYFESLVVPRICPVLKIPIAWNLGKNNDNSISVDKIIPNLGYIPENVRFISRRANMLKNNMTVEEARLIYEDLKRLND